MRAHDKVTVKCLRCQKEHTNTINWWTAEKYRRCPACGGEMDFRPAFSEWLERQLAMIQKMRDDAEQKRFS